MKGFNALKLRIVNFFYELFLNSRGIDEMNRHMKTITKLFNFEYNRLMNLDSSSDINSAYHHYFFCNILKIACKIIETFL